MKSLKVLMALFLGLFALPAMAQKSCHSIHLSEGEQSAKTAVVPSEVEPAKAKKSERANSAKAQWTLGGRDQLNLITLREGSTDIRILLQKMSQSLFESGSPKLTLEKGQLFLGQLLRDGSSVQAEYAADKRKSGVVQLRLVTLTLIRPNGTEIKLDSAPLSAGGDFFVNESYLYRTEHQLLNGQKVLSRLEAVSEKELTEALQLRAEQSGQAVAPSPESAQKSLAESLKQNKHLFANEEKRSVEETLQNAQEISFPRVISGEAMAELKPWIDRLEHLTTAQLAEVNTGRSLNSMRLGFYGRYVRDNMQDTIRKQGFKYVLIGSIAYVVLNFDRMKSWVGVEDLFDLSFDKVSGGSLTREELDTLAKISAGWQPRSEVQELLAELAKMKSSSQPAAAQELVSHNEFFGKLIAAEARAGQGHLEIFDSAHGMAADLLPEVDQQTLSFSKEKSQMPDSLIMAHFKEIRAVTLSLLDTSRRIPRIKTILISQRDYPNLFQHLLKIQSVQKELSSAKDR